MELNTMELNAMELNTMEWNGIWFRFFLIPLTTLQNVTPSTQLRGPSVIFKLEVTYSILWTVPSIQEGVVKEMWETYVCFSS